MRLEFSRLSETKQKRQVSKAV